MTTPDGEHRISEEITWQDLSVVPCETEEEADLVLQMRIERFRFLRTDEELQPTRSATAIARPVELSEDIAAIYGSPHVREALYSLQATSQVRNHNGVNHVVTYLEGYLTIGKTTKDAPVQASPGSLLMRYHEQVRQSDEELLRNALQETVPAK